jgi:hypothetical protein
VLTIEESYQLWQYVVYCGTGCTLNVRDIMSDRYCYIFHSIFDIGPLLLPERKIPEKSCRKVRLVFRFEANVQIQYSCSVLVFWGQNCSRVEKHVLSVNSSFNRFDNLIKRPEYVICTNEKEEALVLLNHSFSSC